MTRQPPRVAGVAGGVGTTTIAAALGGMDCGVVRAGWPVDAVVCADTVLSTGRSHRAVAAVVGMPLLVVVATSTSSMSKATRSRVDMVRPHVSGIVFVPHVMRWRELTDPYVEAAEALTNSQPSKHLRGFARALTQVWEHMQQRAQQGPPALPPASPPQGTPPPTRPPGAATSPPPPATS